MSSTGIFQKLKKALLGGEDKPQATPVSKPETTEPVPQDSLNTALFARQCLKLCGGHDCVTKIDACVSRLRLVLKDAAKIDDDKLKAIGANAVVRIGDKHLQIVVGSKAVEIAEEMKSIPATEDLANIEVPA